jgi:hypothetical protein
MSYRIVGGNPEFRVSNHHKVVRSVVLLEQVRRCLRAC